MALAAMALLVLLVGVILTELSSPYSLVGALAVGTITLYVSLRMLRWSYRQESANEEVSDLESRSHQAAIEIEKLIDDRLALFVSNIIHEMEGELEVPDPNRWSMKVPRYGKRSHLE